MYRIESRNLTIGIFTGRGFIGCREKFRRLYLFEEYLREMPGEPHRVTGTAWAYERLGKTVDHDGNQDYLTVPVENLSDHQTPEAKIALGLLAGFEEINGRLESIKMEFD